VFFRVLRESFARARSRQALAVAAIALGAAVATAMLAVFLNVGDRMARELRSFGANITVVPAADSVPVEIGGIDYRPAAEGAFIAEDELPKLKTIFWRHNIVAFAPYLYVPATLSDGSRTVLVGTWFNHEFTLASGERYVTGATQTNPAWKVEGRAPRDCGGQVSTPGCGLEALVGQRLASRLRQQPGSALAWVPEFAAGGPQSATVVGVLTTGGAEDDQVFIPLRAAQALAAQPGKLRRLQVSALTQPEDAFARRDPKTMTPVEYDRWYCTAYVSSIAAQIQEALPGTVARQVRQVAQNEGEVLKRVQALMLLVTAAALAAAALAVSSATAAMVMERRSEIALMEALGASRWMVAAFFLAEAAVQGIAGGLAGYGVGFWLAGIVGREVFDAPAVPPPVLLPLILTVAVLVSWLGALAPLRGALRQTPAVVLKEGRV
jgi:putative ABC transport system permease protein